MRGRHHPNSEGKPLPSDFSNSQHLNSVGKPLPSDFGNSQHPNSEGKPLPSDFGNSQHPSSGTGSSWFFRVCATAPASDGTGRGTI